MILPHEGFKTHALEEYIMIQEKAHRKKSQTKVYSIIPNLQKEEIQEKNTLIIDILVELHLIKQLYTRT